MRADGSEFPVELAINLIAGTEPPMFTGTVRDITHRRSADEEREELLRLEQLARLDATAGARPAAGDPQRRRRRGDRPGARRPAPVRQRRRAASCSASSRSRSCSPRPATGSGTASRSSTRTASRCPPSGCPGRRALAGRGRRRGGRPLPPARDRRGALVGRQGHADPRRRRLRDDGDQRHRGHHDPQARRARPALPGRQQRAARGLARPGRRARPGGHPGRARGGGLGGGAHARRRRASSSSRSPTATRSASRRPSSSTARCPPAATPRAAWRTCCGRVGRSSIRTSRSCCPRPTTSARGRSTCAASGCAPRWSCR